MSSIAVIITDFFLKPRSIRNRLPHSSRLDQGLGRSSQDGIKEFFAVYPAQWYKVAAYAVRMCL